MRVHVRLLIAIPPFFAAEALIDPRPPGYGLLGATYARGFHSRWTRGEAPPGEPILGSADIQSLADLGNAFDVIRRMRVVPMGLGLVTTLIVGSVVPLVPLLLLPFSFNDLVMQMLRTLFGV